jgi:hypothetical protein
MSQIKVKTVIERGEDYGGPFPVEQQVHYHRLMEFIIRFNK